MNSTVRSDRSFGYVSLAAVLVGAAVFGYGLLATSVSALGGGWIAAIGLALALAGAFDTGWAGRRLGLSARDRRTLSLSCLAVAAILAVAFVVVNGFGGVSVSELESP